MSRWSRIFLVPALVLIAGLAAAEPTPPPISATPSGDTASSSYNPPHPENETLPSGVSAIARIKDPMACAPKEYPHEARVAGEEGKTQLYFLIGPDGKVLDAKIGKSSGFPQLDEAALTAFSNPSCEFLPVMANGQPVKSWARLTYSWKLQ